MEASKWPEGQPAPQVTFSKEMQDGDCVFHFFVDGQESSVTLSREELNDGTPETTYRFKFFGWEFGEADIAYYDGVTSVEYQYIAEGLEDLAKIQAERLMIEATPFLRAVAREDFPGILDTSETVQNF